MPRRPAARDAIGAWLGEGIRLDKGVLAFEGGLRVDGQIDGARIEGPLLVVGRGAKVAGRVRVRRLVVYGRVEGKAHVGEAVQIAAGGVFAGDLVLEQPTLDVEDGGRFEGRVRIAKPRAKKA
ncbi:MAG TPA: polymer-forming cytoskeletal protein [Acidobacteriota bacterium]|nr:polymer-forming cytoskeletal protein [Acidobacteriota bacterium]